MKKNETGGAYGTCGGRRGAYRVLVRTAEGRRPHARLRRRWEDNTVLKSVFKKCDGKTWTGLI
jgi:hypothetical protein